MQTSIIHGERVFADLADEWDALVKESIIDTPFQTLAYQQSWWTHLQPPHSRLYTIISRGENGRLLSIACFYQIGGMIHFNGCVEETDYLDIITRAEDAEKAWSAVFDILYDNQHAAWGIIDLCNIPAHSPSRQIVSKLTQQRAMAFQESIHEVCPVIPLPDTFDAYLAQIDSKQRREIKRKQRRAKGAEVQFVTITDGAELETAVDHFLHLLQTSMHEKRDWLTDGRRAVFHDIARAALEAGTLQLMFAEVEGVRGAALFNFDYNDRVWVYNSGIDTSRFSNLSLGIVLTAHAIETAIKNGRSKFDFLRGNEVYKYRFGAKDTEIFRLHIAKIATLLESC